jgi:hypothetical protein
VFCCYSTELSQFNKINDYTASQENVVAVFSALRIVFLI